MSRSACAQFSAQVFAVLVALAATGVEDATARNPIRTSFFNAYPSAEGSRLDDLPSISGHCGVCHYDFTGGGERNPYGLAVEAEIPNYPNNDQGRQQAMHAIENGDSDGDGYSELVEITDTVNYTNTPTFSGLTPDNVDQVSGVDPNDILAYLVPTSEGDVEPPQITILVPNGGESWEGGSPYTIQWNATDNVEVTAVDLFYRDEADEEWTMIARGLANTGSHEWFVLNTPTAAARVRGVARDAVSNEGEDVSDGDFTILLEPGALVPTTLRDFEQPGSQPFDAGRFEDHTACSDCHGGYDPAVEPVFNWQGSMMGQAMRDPLFIATLIVAEQDASSSGDLCLRCHTPMGWLSGRSTPTDGGQITAIDRDAVSCDFCHRMVDPVYEEGVSPPQDQEVLAALDGLPDGFSNGMQVVDWRLDRRGPFGDAAAPHPFLESPFHQSAEFCGTCHDVSNPVFHKVGEGDYEAGPLDEEAETITSEELLPVERTYSEWLHSDFPAGIYAPEFAGNKPDGIVATCQDCHMRDVEGTGCDDPDAPVRADLPLHDLTGGNSWVPTILDQVFPGEVDPAALAAASARAVSMLEKAASLDLALTGDNGAIRADLTILNRTGHKLPTGYPEGRRIWVHVVARDDADQVVYESGAYDPATGVLDHDADLVLYEAKPGLSPALAGALGLEAG
ncbi:MAG: hypothetical protein GF346_07815, partial [Candidatus Eisenbacteria bacterium]|nr:hypothetical protein [Candidatus Latescibacterota bacterium]MBD3302339.1 hypothetical protein [Candidatus Eisenbacteria bacterium]